MDAQTFAAPAWGLLVLAVVLVIIAGVFVALSTALTNLSHARAQDLVEEGRRHGEDVVFLLRHPRRAVLTARAVQFGCQSLAVASLTLAAASMWHVWWVVLLAVFAAAAVLTLFIDGMVAPQLGRTRPEACALWLAPALRLPLKLAGLGRPLMRLLAALVPPPAVTDAEARQEMVLDLREMVDDLGEEEQLEIAETERDMLRSVFEMGTTLIREIIVPRTDMVTIDRNANGHAALALASHSGYSRIPVTGVDADDVRGVVYLKDLVHRLLNRPDLMDRPVSDLMREATFVPETMRVDDLLASMQNGAPHLAVVFDEWGGTVGLVTIEDELEELVGEVTDEHDKREIDIEEIGARTWRVPARLPLDDLEDLTGVEIDEDDVDTVGGLLQKALGKVPLVGDEARAWGIDLKAEAADGRRHQVCAIVASISSDDEGEDQ